MNATKKSRRHISNIYLNMCEFRAQFYRRSNNLLVLNQELEAKGVEKEIIDNKFKSPEAIIEHLSDILTKRKEPLRDDITCLIISGF